MDKSCLKWNCDYKLIIVFLALFYVMEFYEADIPLLIHAGIYLECYRKRAKILSLPKREAWKRNWRKNVKVVLTYEREHFCYFFYAFGLESGSLWVLSWNDKHILRCNFSLFQPFFKSKSIGHRWNWCHLTAIHILQHWKSYRCSPNYRSASLE